MSLLEVRGLSLALGGKAVLRGASLALEQGELGLLTGPSGTGKSAFLKLVLGLTPRASRLTIGGDLRLLGMDARRSPTPMLARRAGLLFQDAPGQLTQPDVASELAFRVENLGLAPRDVEDRVASSVRRFALGSLQERPVAALSGGEAKRVALAGLMAAEPEVLLLDEPLGGLDQHWRRVVLRDLAREARDLTALVVEHRAEELARLADRVWRVEGGRPVEGRAPARRPRARPRPRGASPWPLVLGEDVVVRRDGREVVRGTFEAGAGMALLAGPNGSGKTSLLRSMAGLAPFEGALRVAGKDPAREGPRGMARVVGYVPQRAEDMFFHASVREELGAGQGLADRLGLAPLLDRHPSTLSGGEQQRLAIACALAHGPRVLLLDEPTVGLDAQGLAQVLGALDAARAGVAVLVASHDPELRGLADQVLAVERGRVRAARALEVAA